MDEIQSNCDEIIVPLLPHSHRFRDLSRSSKKKSTFSFVNLASMFGFDKSKILPATIMRSTTQIITSKKSSCENFFIKKNWLLLTTPSLEYAWTMMCHAKTNGFFECLILADWWMLPNDQKFLESCGYTISEETGWAWGWEPTQITKISW